MVETLVNGQQIYYVTKLMEFIRTYIRYLSQETKTRNKKTTTKTNTMSYRIEMKDATVPVANPEDCDNANLPAAYIRVAEPGSGLARLLAPDDRVITDEEFTLRITYPLSNSAHVKVCHAGGVTRTELVHTICASYRTIYEEEKKTSKYGFYAHSIDDLHLIAASYDPNTKICSLSIDS